MEVVLIEIVCAFINSQSERSEQGGFLFIPAVLSGFFYVCESVTRRVNQCAIGGLQKCVKCGCKINTF